MNGTARGRGDQNGAAGNVPQSVAGSALFDQRFEPEMLVDVGFVNVVLFQIGSDSAGW